MKNLFKIASIGLLLATAAFGQLNTILQTSLNGAITANQTVFTLTSATGVVAPSTFAGIAGSALWIQDIGQSMGEVANVLSVNGNQVQVIRTSGRATSHNTGAMVLVATAPNWFRAKNPQGSVPNCTGIPANIWLNTETGEQWLCSASTLSYVAGWGNTRIPAGPTAAVASAAGAIIPSGPLFHITGALAITGFTLPTGFLGGSFTAIADGAYTWTAAGNIAVAGAATTVGATVTFTWDPVAKKWYPSRIA